MRKTNILNQSFGDGTNTPTDSLDQFFQDAGGAPALPPISGSSLASLPDLRALTGSTLDGLDGSADASNILQKTFDSNGNSAAAGSSSMPGSSVFSGIGEAVTGANILNQSPVESSGNAASLAVHLPFSIVGGIGEIAAAGSMMTTPVGGIGEIAAAVAPLFTSTAPADQLVYAIGERYEGEGVPSIETVQSRPLIDWDDFMSNPLYAGINGTGVTVAILDTGADLNHPFFGPDTDGNGIADRIVHQQNFIGADLDAEDGNGHGTNVAGIVGSQNLTYTGMAPGVNFIILRVLADNGSGTSTALEQAMQWCVTNAATYNLVSINMSLGFGDNTNVPDTDFLTDECLALNNQNVTVVSAAGNDYFEFQAQGVSYPASDPYSWAVGAVYDANVGARNYSSGAQDFTTAADRITSFSQRSTSQVDIFAPGAIITNAGLNGSTVGYSGTSQAAPHIAGIAALMQDLSLEISGDTIGVNDLRTLMRNSAVTIFDGDDENDNVTNTSANYLRVDVDNFAAAVVQYWQTATTGGDTLYGWRGNDTINGLGGNDTISAGQGNDTINGGIGANTIDGGAGRDVVTVDATFASSTLIHNANGSWTISYAGGSNTVTNVEAVQFTGGTVVALREPTQNDFASNGASDVLFRNSASGDLGFYEMTDGTFTGWHGIGGASTAYTVVGNGDFNGDGTTDILFRNNANGDTGFYQLNMDGTLQGWHGIGGSSAAYTVAGVGDFNRDGVSDILFRDNSTGSTGFYQMTGNGTLQGWHGTGGSSTAYSVVGVGDFNADGVSDILFRNNATGDTGFNQINSNGTLQGWHSVGGSVTSYDVVGVGDFNTDGVSDILFRNNATGDLGFYQLNSNGTLQGWHGIGGSSTAYSVVDVGDYSGDGTADILFRNNATGDTGFYELSSNGSLEAWHGIGGSSTGYIVV